MQGSPMAAKNCYYCAFSIPLHLKFKLIPLHCNSNYWPATGGGGAKSSEIKTKMINSSWAGAELRGAPPRHQSPRKLLMYYFSLLPLIMHCIGIVVKAGHTLAFWHCHKESHSSEMYLHFVSVSCKPQEFWILYMIQDFKILKGKAALTQLLARCCVQKSDYPVVWWVSCSISEQHRGRQLRPSRCRAAEPGTVTRGHGTRPHSSLQPSSSLLGGAETGKWNFVCS